MSEVYEDFDCLDEQDREEYRKTKRTTMYKKQNTAPLEKELIVVELSASGQYGPYIKANGEFYGMNEPLTDADFQKGEAYNILFKRGKPSDKSPNGKKYIVQIVGGSETTSASSPASPEKGSPERSTKEVAKDNFATGEAAKQKRILWQGVVQAVAQSPVFAGTDEATFVASVEKSAEKLVAFINEKAV